MNNSGRQRWFVSALLAGALYPVIALLSASLAAAATTNQTRFFWRLSAFIVSGGVFLAHLAYEHFRLRHSPRPTAWHVAVAVGLGAFALATMANIHDLRSPAGYRPRMLVALIAWPLLTAVPAFVVALIVTTVLAMKRPSEI